MSEIYIKKKVFWKEEQNVNINKIFIIISVIVLVIILISQKKEDEINFNNKFDENLNNSVDINFESKLFEKLKIGKNFSKDDQTKNNNKILNFNHVWSKLKNINPILQSKIYEEDYYYSNFQKNYTNLLFLFCKNNYIISNQIEKYYNFSFNRKIKPFKILNDFADDYTQNNFNNDKICFSSGKAHIALETKTNPSCIEFKNIQINNFLYENKNNSNIIIKFHIFKVKNNKVHIYPVKKQVLSTKHYVNYFDSNLEDEFIDKNVIIYNNKNEKFIRICNFMSEEIINSNLYENKFWLEFNWDPKIQNVICFEEFGYLP